MADSTLTRGRVQLSGLGKDFAGQQVIGAIDLDIQAGQFVVFVGPSGCGKSTLLRLIAGLEQPTRGRLAIGGKDVTSVHPAQRGIAMVFQSYALYPHMNVAENMGFGLRMRGMAKAEIEQRVQRAAASLQLTALLQRKPKDLSGGQRQRVAIGRAIVREPEVFLFDEPLSNLDAGLRGQMRVEIARLHAHLGATMIYVTHDQVEAMTLADRIVVLNAGRIEQVGSPMELYRRPANRFVAGFIGAPQMNFLELEVQAVNGRSLTLQAPAGALELELTQPLRATTSRLTLGVRPEHLRQARPGETVIAEGSVQLLERLGAETLVHVQLANAIVLLKLDGDIALERGQRLQLAADRSELRLFAADGASLELVA